MGGLKGRLCEKSYATNSPFAREVIERIGAVYAIEERIRGLDADERRAARQAETKPLMEALKGPSRSGEGRDLPPG